MSIKDQVVEFVDGQLALPASFKEALLEEEPAGDIYDNLAGTLQRGFQDSDLLLAPGLLQGRVTDDRLTEDTGGFFQCHVGRTLQHATPSQVYVVLAITPPPVHPPHTI